MSEELFSLLKRCSVTLKLQLNYLIILGVKTGEQQPSKLKVMIKK